MPAPKSCWAVDIGQCAIKAIHARLAEDGKIEIDGFCIVEHEKILSHPDADEPALIKSSLGKLVEKCDNIDKEPLIISIPGHKSFARFSKLPPVDPKKLPDIIKYEATQQIPFGIEEVVWDYHVFRSEESPEVEVGIFAVKRNIIAQYLQYFYEVGLSPITVQMVPIAIYNACYFEELIGPEATVIADVGAQNANFLIAEDFKLWTRNIPIGGNNFTEALQKSFKVNFEKAEHLKRTATTSKYVRTAFQAMRPVFSELATEFQRSIGFYTSINREAEIKQIYAMGNTFRLPGLLKFLQQNTGIPVKKLENFSKVKLAGNVNEMEFSENILTLTPVYGLAVQQLGLGTVDTDLTPPEILREVMWKRKQFWFIGAAACLALAAGAVWLRAVSDTSAIKTDLVQNEPRIKSIIQKYKRYQKEYRKYTNSETFKSPIVDQIREILEERKLTPLLLREISTSLPKPPVSITSVKTIEEYKQALTKIPRHKRSQIFISSIEFTYIPELNEQELEKLEASAKSSTIKVTTKRKGKKGKGFPTPEFGPMGPMGPMEMGPGPGMAPPGLMQKGKLRSKSKRKRKAGRKKWKEKQEGGKAFLVTIRGITPHEDAPTFLTNTIVKNLRAKDKKYAAENNLNFWIDRVKLISSLPLVVPEKEEYRDSSKDKEYRGPIDPLTGEKMDKDAEFTVTFVVHIGKPMFEEKGQKG